jgi:hypothetical protein
MIKPTRPGALLLRHSGVATDLEGRRRHPRFRHAPGETRLAAPSSIAWTPTADSRAGGAKIIMIGSLRRSARFAKVPLVVYGGTPIDRAY